MDSQAGARAAATVLAHVLGIDDDPSDLVSAFTPLSSEPPVAVWAVELDAEGEDVAFLLYAYNLTAADSNGIVGRDVLERDLAVIAEAADRGAPGPRLVAQGEVGNWSVVVATSPTTLERLGAFPTAQPDRPASTAAPPASPRERARAANALLVSLRAAEQRSLAFLAAVGDGGDPPTPEERALALFIADGRALASLPRALRVAVERAADQAAGSPT